MMKQIQQSVCALAVLAATSLPVMADSVAVRVIGTIKPAACTPTLSGGAVIDYGNIGTNTLSPTAYTVLPEKKIDFSITCDALARVAIKAVNGRPNTLAGAVEGGVSGSGTAPAGVNLFGAGSDTGAVGLGLDSDGRKIGGYAVRIDNSDVTADGVLVDTINTIESNVGGSWAGSASAVGGLYNPNDIRVVSWSEKGKETPIAFRLLSGKLGVQAYLNKSSELDLNKEIILDGLTTIELIYI